MTNRRIFFVFLLAFVGSMVHAQQPWMTSYEKALRSARANDWVGARAAFQQAVAYRPEDASGATTLPGPVSERRQWRDGAPYSPNFLAAYSEYRIGITANTAEDARPALDTAATEFEVLLSKGQASKETFFYLNQIYTRMGDTEKRQNLEAKFQVSKKTFRVDTEIVAPAELSVINGSSGVGPKQGAGPQVSIIRPGQNATPILNPGGANVNQETVAPTVGAVPPVPSKYALIVGNSATQLKQGAVTFGSDDAQAVSEALVAHAGYLQSNVDLVLNTTRDQLLASARALAARIPENATVFIFFSGNGANIDGKDYLAGVDTTSESDATTMVSKMEIYRMFMAKAPKIYAFFEVPRPMINGVYFGKEIPLLGSIAQTQATIPGDGVSSEVHNGHEVGIFAGAIVTSLQDIRSNRIPIMEFGWQVFNRTRGGGAAADSTGARQVPTLPVLTHMSDLDRF